MISSLRCPAITTLSTCRGAWLVALHAACVAHITKLLFCPNRDHSVDSPALINGSVSSHAAMNCPPQVPSCTIPPAHTQTQCANVPVQDESITKTESKSCSENAAIVMMSHCNSHQSASNGFQARSTSPSGRRAGSSPGCSTVSVSSRGLGAAISLRYADSTATMLADRLPFAAECS